MKPLPQLPSLKESIKEQLEDRLIQALLILGALTVFTGFADSIAWGWLEGFSIFVAVGFLVSVAAWNDYEKDKQFLSLLGELKDEEIIAIRGKRGETQGVNVFDLAVGDIVLLETGCRIPADCVLLTGMDVVANEGKYNDVDVFEV